MVRESEKVENRWARWMARVRFEPATLEALATEPPCPTINLTAGESPLRD